MNKAAKIVLAAIAVIVLYLILTFVGFYLGSSTG